jgi:endonuclease YncB( thermonuclease family)
MMRTDPCGRGRAVYDWIRGGAVAAAGLAAGVFCGFCIWGWEGEAPGLSRVYSDGERVRVAKAIDGDTIVLDDGVHVRYRGCDAPELSRFVRQPEPFAEEATRRNRALVEGAWVTLRFPDPASPALDRHGRAFADVRLEGGGEEPVAVLLVREGLARAEVYDVRGRLADDLREAEAEARSARRGLWGEPPPLKEGAPFVGSRWSEYVHRAECRFARLIGPDNLVAFDSLEAALEEGRRRCPTCLVPGRSVGREEPRVRGPDPGQRPTITTTPQPASGDAEGTE